MHHQYHELEVLVNGRSVFCYTRAQKIPTVEGMLALIEEAMKTDTKSLAAQP
jgi:hypothetical protein